MKINTSPVKGTVDYLPADMEIRQQAISTILEQYLAHGFLQVKTPILESLQILTTGDSGDNQKLMFKTLKRGEKLDLKKPNLTEADVAEEGLRYDLTVPLARFYASNREKLPLPFKAIQIDESFRAEKPQRGRNRQFTQCDIDIWGDSSEVAECEILIASAQCYKKIGITDVVFKISDRKILLTLISDCGFNLADQNKVCTVLDKLDKIGEDGVKAELTRDFSNYPAIEQMAQKLVSQILTLKQTGLSALDNYPELLEVKSRLEKIISVVRPHANIVFDVTVVRGQGYYTGTVFEAYTGSHNFSRAIGGGGRYDKMLEKFLGTNVPAVGFSIGLDTVVLILKEAGIATKNQKFALIYAKDTPIDQIFATKLQLLAKGYQISLYLEPKNYKNFCERLKNNNFTGIIKLDRPDKILPL